MLNILEKMSSQIIFWSAWIIIPLLMEIVPSIFGFLVLLRKKIKFSANPELLYYPEISIIIPVYNSAGTLEMCISSIVESDYPIDKIGILLVNNGSKDHSFEIYKRYQEEHPEINMKWMNSKQGKSKALNMALFNSKGKYIIHIDSDGILHANALTNLVKRFEGHSNIHCMTGTILTNPDSINHTNKFTKRFMQKIEFYEYAQAFLAGRNFEAEWNNIFTMSGAFSAFRKSTILKTQLYNTETVCEDTHITFQVRKLLKKRIDICENAIFFVEPIESMDTLYVQRQRWQRGELEVAHMFPERSKFSMKFMTKLLLYDHTFAFPRMIWYFALICLTFMNYPFSFIVHSVLLIYVLYCISAFLYYLNICSYLKWDKNLRNFYARKIIMIFCLPIFNFIIYWFRMAGIINSIKIQSQWKTKSWKEECGICKQIMKDDFKVIGVVMKKVRHYITNED